MKRSKTEKLNMTKWMISTVVIFLGVSSCATFFPYTHRTVEKRCTGEENRQFLTDICQGKEPAERYARQIACKCIGTMDREIKNANQKADFDTKIAEYDKTLLRESKNKNSKKIIKEWGNISDILWKKSKHLYNKYWYKTYIAIAESGDYDYVIVKALHSPHGEGYYLMQKLHKQGLPIGREIIKFISCKSFDFKYADEAAKQIKNYFLSQEWLNHGKVFTKLLQSRNPGVITAGLMYLEKTNYSEAQNIVLKKLGHNSAEVRKWACRVLAKIGNRNAISRLKLIASRDSAFIIKQFNKIYFVRNAANQAIISINSR